MICAAATGDPVPAEDAVETTATTRAALGRALEESTNYCARVYAQTAAAVGRPAQLFGQTMPRMGALDLNAVHNGEHYARFVAYMRMTGMVPPPSCRPARRPRPARGSKGRDGSRA